MKMNDDAAEKTNTCRPTSLQAHTHKVDATTANEMKLMMSAICRRLRQIFRQHADITTSVENRSTKLTNHNLPLSWMDWM
jgi:hypothetical protein